MQMKRITNYSIRSMIILASVERISAHKLAIELNIAESYVLKILKHLKEAKFIVSVSGNNGGYQLFRNPETITLLEVITVMEPTIKINRCLESDCFCSRDATACCAIRKVYAELQSEMDEMLSTITIANLLLEKIKDKELGNLN